MPSPRLPIGKSIAVSVIVRPSRWTLLALAGLAFLCMLVALTTFFDQAERVTLVVRIPTLVIGLAAAVLCGLELSQRRSSYLLDITGTGDLRLSAISIADNSIPIVAETSDGEIRFLAAGSLITPLLMILRIADKHDNVNTLLIFPDSVSQDAFRRLALACRWLAAQHSRRQPKDL